MTDFSILRATAMVAAAVLTLGTASAAGPQPVADALQRPALTVQYPARGVMLGAARAGERVVADRKSVV